MFRVNRTALLLFISAIVAMATAGCGPAEHEITLEVKPEEAGGVAGEGRFSQGEVVEIAAEAKEGYEFQKWVEDGEEITTDHYYTFEADGDRKLEAHFKKVTETVNGVKLECAEVVFDRELPEEVGREVPLRAFPVEEGLLVAYDQTLRLKDPATGEPVWILENYEPILAEGVDVGPLPRFAPFYRENEAIVLPMFDYVYDGDKIADDYDRVASLVKLNPAAGEVIWSHPLARNTPPLMVSELSLKDESIIAEGNFDVQVDREVPAYGVHAAALAVHDYATGDLVYAHAGYYGDTKTIDDYLFYSHVEYGVEDDPEKMAIYFGKKDLLTGELAWELDKEETVEVVGLTPAGEISWRMPGKLLDSGKLVSLTGLPQLPEAVLVEGSNEVAAGAGENKALLTARGIGTADSLVELVDAADGSVIESSSLAETAENVEAFMEEGIYYLFTGDPEKELVTVESLDAKTGEIYWTKEAHILQSELPPERAVMMMGRLVSEAEALVRLSGYFPVMDYDQVLRFIDPLSGEDEAVFEGIRNVLSCEEQIYLIGSKNFKVVCPDELTVVREKELAEIFFTEAVEAIEIEIWAESGDAAIIGPPEEFAVFCKENGEMIYRCKHEDYHLSTLVEGDHVLLNREGRLLMIGPR